VSELGALLNRLPPLVGWSLAMLLFWWVVLALGHRILRWLAVPLSVSPAEKGLLALTVGAGTLQLLPYTLAAFGRLRPGFAIAAFAVLALLLVPDLWHVARRLRTAIGGLSLQGISRPAAIWGALFVLVMAILLVRATAFSAFGSDDDGYHLSAPKRWLESGTLHYLPTYTNTNASLGFEMLYTLALATGSPFGAKLLHYSAGLFTLLAIWLSARRLGSGRAGLLAISLLLIAQPLCDLPSLFRVAYVDFGACWMTMVSVLVYLLWRERQQPRLLVLLALVAGFAASFKSTALSVTVAWLPVLAWEWRRRDIAWRPIVGRAIRFGLIAAIPVLPWFLRSWRVTGNPVFPMLSGLIPTRDWSPELAGVFNRFFHYYSWGIASGARLGEAQRKELVLGTALLMLIGTGIATARLRHPAMRCLVVFSGLFGLIAVLMGGMVFRYWLPAMMCATVVAASWLTERWRSQRGPLWLASAFLVIAIPAMMRGRVWSTGSFGGDLRLATGSRSMDQTYAADPAWNTWKFINANTPPDARVLMASFYTTNGACNYGGFWVDRTCYTTDSHAQIFIRLDGWLSFLESVRKAGVSHMVIFDAQFTPGRHGFSFPASLNEYPFCRRLADELGEKLAQFDHMQIYRVHPERVTARAP
jgi:hypothetical protein